MRRGKDNAGKVVLSSGGVSFVHKVSFCKWACVALVEILYITLYIGLHFPELFPGTSGVSMANVFVICCVYLDGWCLPEFAEFTGCTCVCVSTEHWTMTVTASGGQGAAALSPSHACTRGTLRAHSFSINLEIPYLLQLLAPFFSGELSREPLYYELAFEWKIS